MEYGDDEGRWYAEERLYSGRDSDDSPLLSHRCIEKRQYQYRYPRAVNERERSTSVSLLTKCLLVCGAVILCCVLLYIPVYKKASYQLSKAAVAGWSTHTSRDTRLYVLPDNVTTVHEPPDLCHRPPPPHQPPQLFLLIVVCSATDNFERRAAIRGTWGNYSKYTERARLYHAAGDKYRGYNYSYDLYAEGGARGKRDVFQAVMPEIARMMTPGDEGAGGEGAGDDAAAGDDGDGTVMEDFYDDEETNVMKIPPRGYEDNPDLGALITMLRKNGNFPKVPESESAGDTDTQPDFRLVFLVGLPAAGNGSHVQERIEGEGEVHGDVIQEGFADTYNNLTLKTIMMLKWITQHCNGSVRYILKTDDDMYVNVPRLVENLRARSEAWGAARGGAGGAPEHLLIGDLICGARPVLDANNKWYSPGYMYSGRVYPRYLSGMGYALSWPTAAALYAAALRTPYFHLEDIYITGMCALRASPLVRPRDDPSFSYAGARGGGGGVACAAHAHVTSHRVSAATVEDIDLALAQPDIVDRCERIRLTQVRKDRLRPKTPTKKLTKYQH